jgi:hypothetical protein
VNTLEPGGEAMGEVVCIGYGAGIGPEYKGVFQSNLAHLLKRSMVGMPISRINRWTMSETTVEVYGSSRTI